MKINITKIIIFGFVAFFLSIFWLGLKKDNNYDTKNIIGNKISNFQLPSIYSNDFISEESLKDNKFTLINFFASWCGPCRLEHQYLLNLSNNSKNIKILGINFKDKRANATSFLNELGNPYSSLAEDVDGKASILFGIYGIPESILVNDKLTIIKKIVGPIDKKQYEQILELVQ
jgi:cytochrome c biogenesis protein CcmG/thiol:disulfide interchange protein DsbE|tara:strand:- start:214 stop:735 length:522 start_codon:yes stop_codon:yes gene_type:complete